MKTNKKHESFLDVKSKITKILNSEETNDNH